MRYGEHFALIYKLGLRFLIRGNRSTVHFQSQHLETFSFVKLPEDLSLMYCKELKQNSFGQTEVLHLEADAKEIQNICP